MADCVIALESPRLGYGNVELQNPDKVCIPAGVTAVIGPNGSGKTTFGTILEKGRYAYGNRLRFTKPDAKVKMLAFSDIHSLSGMEVQYFAQRMESTMNDLVPSVADIIGDKIFSEDFKRMCTSLGLKDAVHKKVNFLSSGELRKLIIINALLGKPDILILDNPYIGLDATSRAELDDTFGKLRKQGMAIILLVCDNSEIPQFTDTVIEITGRKIHPPKSLEDYSDSISSMPPLSAEISLPDKTSGIFSDFLIAFRITDGHIRYGDHQVLSGFDWTVRNGERWILTGPNGSGKSLLLSMIYADNPQGYANDITLFDRKRGSGESIWEIKDHIGYVSPEMQLFFKSSSSVRDIIVQGMRRNLNLYGKPSQDEIDTAVKWMDLLGISVLADRRFQHLSSGEQRLVLVARAMIKQPELLILDEPLHGLDAENKENVKNIINEMARMNNTTIIFVTHYTEEIPACITNKMTLIKH